MTSEGSENNSELIQKMLEPGQEVIQSYDLSILSSILDQITIQEWRQSTLNKV